MAMRAVDLDLFVNSFSKGVQDGAKIPSGFSSFFGGLITGMDAEEKAQAQRLQNELNQNKVEQLPVENRMREAETQLKEAQADVVTQPGYAELQAQKLKNDQAQQQREADLNMKRTEFLEIMQGDDGDAKGKAYLSGRYDELFAADPKLKEMTVERTFKEWGQDDQKSYLTIQRKGRERDWYTAVSEATQKKNYENEQAFLGSDEIADLREKAGGISPVDLLEKGEIREITVPPKRPIFKDATDEKGQPLKDKNGLPIKSRELQKDEYGSVLMEDDPSADGKDFKSRKGFFYDGKLISDSISDEAAKNYKNYKQTYKYQRNLEPGQNGDTDRKKEADQVRARKEADAAASKVSADEQASRVKQQQDDFFAGAKISPRYSQAAQSVQKTISENRASVQQPAGAPDATGGVKEGQPNAGQTRVSVPTMKPGMSDEDFFNKSVEFASSPRETVFDLNSGAQVPKPSWVKNAEIKQQMAASKAQSILQKYTSQNKAPPAERPNPVDQAKTVTSDSFVPQKMDVNTSFSPNVRAIRVVANKPEVQNFSALTKAVMVQESGGVDAALSPTGVRGSMQVTGSTAKSISEDIDRTDPVQSVLAGAIELEKLLATPQFESNPMLALTAFNAGPGVVAEAIRMAGTTEWSVVKKFIEPATLKFSDHWNKKKVDPSQKAKEASEYAEKVIVNFPAFVRSRTDMSIAANLKRQGVLVF